MEYDTPKSRRRERTMRFPPDLEAALEMARRSDGVTFHAEVMQLLKAAMEVRYGSLDGYADKHPPIRKKALVAA